jgi:hypothetical protein
MQTVTIVKQHKYNGETLTYNDTVVVDSLLALDLAILPGAQAFPATLAMTQALAQSIYICSNQPVTLYINGASAVQSITISGGVTGGTFTASYGGNTTTGVAWNAAAATLQTALQALASIGAGNALVTGGAGGPYTVTFAGTLGLTPITTMTASAAGLTGGTPAIAVASVTTGVVPVQTEPLQANGAIDWIKLDGYFSIPIPHDITMVAVTNPNSVGALVQFRIGQWANASG